MTVSHWHTSASAHRVVDVAIVGGGITGLSTAYWLKKLAPERSVVVLDARGIAGGATGRNAGFLICGTAESYGGMIEEYGRETARFVWDATRTSIELTRAFLDETGADVDLVPEGSLVAAGDDDEAEELARSAPLLAEDGFDVEFFDHDLLDRGFRAGLFNRTDCGVHPVKIARALAETSGVEIIAGASVGEVRDAGARVSLVSAHGVVEASTVVVAVNAWAPMLLPDLDGLVRPVRGQVLVTEPLRERLLGPMVYANRGFEYFRQLPDGRFLMGGWRKRFADTEIGYGEETTDGVQTGLETYMHSLYPESAEARIDRRWSGTMGFSPDLLPVFGRSTRDERVVFGVGFSGHGMSLGLWSGRTLAHATLGGEIPAPFAAERFNASKHAPQR